MRRPTILSASFALVGVAALTVTGVAAGWIPAQPQTTVEPAAEIDVPNEAVGTDAGTPPVEPTRTALPPRSTQPAAPTPPAEPTRTAAPTRASEDTADEVAEPYEGPGTVDEPVYACLSIDGREVCDTFGESDEGPGTTSE